MDNDRPYALRGYAIVTMVLSGAVVCGVLPGWMYHAQILPPTHVFYPAAPGITWADLAFPFFVFAMGSALPFSIRKSIEKGESKLKLIYAGQKRSIIRIGSINLPPLFKSLYLYRYILES